MTDDRTKPWRYRQLAAIIYVQDFLKQDVERVHVVQRVAYVEPASDVSFGRSADGEDMLRFRSCECWAFTLCQDLFGEIRVSGERKHVDIRLGQDDLHEGVTLVVHPNECRKDGMTSSCDLPCGLQTVAIDVWAICEAAPYPIHRI